MARVNLTKTAALAAEPGERDLYLWDTSITGFGLRVTPNGSKFFLVQYRIPGDSSRTRRVSIGPFGDTWSVTRARDEAIKIRARVDLGHDPFAETKSAQAEARAKRLAAKAAQEAAVETAFARVVDRYIASRKKARRKAWAETERILKKDAVAEWANTPVAAITKAQVRALINKVEERSDQAARLLFAHLRSMFNWLVGRGDLDRSPCENIKAPSRPEARSRVLTDREIQLLWGATEKLGWPFGSLYRLALLTGQRREEVAAMKWSELDLEDAVWRLPATRTKNASAHEVDLSPQALAELVQLPRTSGWVFSTNGQSSVSGFSKAKARLDHEMDRLARKEHEEALGEGALQSVDDYEPIPDWRMHDLRRTAATRMAGLGFPPIVVERVINHVSGARGGLVGVYQHFEYRDERRAAVLGWGAALEALVSRRCTYSYGADELDPRTDGPLE